MNRKVKGLMAFKGLKGVDIAKKLHVSPTTVYIVISGRGKSCRIQKYIAAELGMSVAELWPASNKAA
ncbi:hypothetical protein EPN18_09765 [bacterium]|nr:MAG: hypothetical protein EPN18_09765 [bacterium]